MGRNCCWRPWEPEEVPAHAWQHLCPGFTLGSDSGASKAEERSSGGFNPHKRGRRSNCRTQCYHPTWAPTDTLGTETTEQASWARAGGGGGATVSHRLLPAHCGVHNKKLREGEGGLDGGGGAGVGEGKFSGKLNSLD